MLSGYNPTNLIVVAARTGVGKSSYALRQMLNMAKQNIPTLMFSYEMSKKELSQRMVSMESGVPLLNIRTGNVSDKELQEIKDTYLKVSTYPIYLDTSASDSLSYLLSTIRRYVRTSGVKVVFVDYLQLMARNTDNLVRDLGKVTKALKLLAMELDIVVVALSQINRGVESRDNKRPQLFDLRDSGNIEEDANIVLMLYRPALSGGKFKDEDEFLCEILVRKNRNGPLGAINAYFKAENADIVNSLTEIIRGRK
jgi:replicative DNA helicase